MKTRSMIIVLALLMSSLYSRIYAQTGGKPDINAIVRQFHVNYSNNDVEKNGTLVSDDLVVQLNGGADNKVNGATYNGRDQFVSWLKAHKTIFPDGKIVDNNIVVSGNKAAIRFTFTGTQSGPIPTPSGPIPASGRKVVMHGTEFFTFNDSGKLIHLETLSNDLGVITQVTAK